MNNGIHNLPVLGICGWSGSGKTTLIESVLPELGARGLRVVVIKHDAHGVDIDRPGKDSDRFFRAGADVLLEGPSQDCLRQHASDAVLLTSKIKALVREYDLVLVEGHKGTPLPKIWLRHPQLAPPPAGLSDVLGELAFGPGRDERLLGLLEAFLDQRWRKGPLYACVLIGGKSRRMGSPKHLLKLRRRTWLEHTVSAVEHVAAKTVLVGQGAVPESLRGLPRLPDIPDASGPMAGMMAAMRWAPAASWVMTACDLPFLSRPAVEWLASFRRPGVWAAVPRLPRSAGVEPLLAYYDYRAAHLFERVLDSGSFCPADIVGHEKVAAPTPPAALAPAWRNMNTPADVKVHADLA